MVKFGRHQRYFLDNELHDNFYVVPYCDARSDIEKESPPHPEAFEATWRSYLQKAKENFDSTLGGAWRTIYRAIDTSEEARGAPPDKALLLLAQRVPKEQVQQSLDDFKRIHATALINTEALRKLVKKYDKHHPTLSSDIVEEDEGQPKAISTKPPYRKLPIFTIIDSVKQSKQQNPSQNQPCTSSSQTPVLLSIELLPELYAANFVLGLSALKEAIELLRSELGLGEYGGGMAASVVDTCFQGYGSSPPQEVKVDDIHDQGKNNSAEPSQATPADGAAVVEEHHSDAPGDPRDSQAAHEVWVTKRKLELQWLRQFVARISKSGSLHHAVAHRGFHSPQDLSDRRPIENSLQAYETAWTSGIHLCECDIALTKDEHLVLAHDEDFSRLALDESGQFSSLNVRDLTLQQIMSVPLKSGSRPPLLLDVFRSASVIGTHAQLIVEIKPGNPEAATALARLFAEHPEYMPHCQAVMSFDSFVMHRLHEELDVFLGTSPTKGREGASVVSGGRTHRKLSCYSMGGYSSSLLVAMKDAERSMLQREGQVPHTRPKLLVLTVSDTPEIEVELQVSVTEKTSAVEILNKIHGWVKGLDGVYMQFEPHMLTKEGCKVLQTLASRYHVGVWGLNGRDPDDFVTFCELVHQGKVSFVNTDLPHSFFHDDN